MPVERSIAVMLLFVFLYALNSLHQVLRHIPDKAGCKENFFVEIVSKGKRATVMGFCKKPDLKIGCALRNGISIRIDDSRIICRDMSAYKKITLGIPISINREDIYGLCAIPGIGPHTARQIIEERRKRGGFKNLEELLQVKGIGRKIYNKILPYITL